MTRDELKLSLGMDELLTVTREELTSNPDPILAKIDAGCSPILIIADGKPDLLMFSWEDYERRYAALYPPEEFQRLEDEFKKYKEDK